MKLAYEAEKGKGMAVLYPVQGVPKEIISAQGQFTRNELEGILGGAVAYHRKMRKIAFDYFEPYGDLIVVREEGILTLPINQTIDWHVGESIQWGPVITIALSELNEKLPLYLIKNNWVINIWSGNLSDYYV